MLCIPDSCPARHSRDEELYTSLQHNRSTTKVQSERHRTVEAYAPCGAEWKQKGSAVAGCELLIKYHRSPERVVPDLTGEAIWPLNLSLSARNSRESSTLAVPGHIGVDSEPPYSWSHESGYQNTVLETPFISSNQNTVRLQTGKNLPKVPKELSQARSSPPSQ